jgi:hypothetical protein
MDNAIDITEQQHDVEDLGIVGLRFVANHLNHAGERAWTKIVSNRGYVVGNVVVHAADAPQAQTLDLHIGRIDELTFIATSPRELAGTFLDCRAGSPSFGRRLELSFSTSPARRLIIPAGVAHRLTNLGGVIVRNDLRLLCTASSQRWQAEGDRLSLPLDISADAIPPVVAHPLTLPRTVALLLVRLQRELLLEALGPAGSADALTVEWCSLPEPVSQPFGVRAEPNARFAAGEGASALIASTANCVTELWLVRDLAAGPAYAVHTYYEILHTFLDHAGEQVRLEVIDLRRGSPTFAATATLVLACSEAVHLRIPAGVAYRYRTPGRFCVRVEAELFMRGIEKRLPTLEQDTRTIYPGYPIEAIEPPNLPTAGDVLLGLTEFDEPEGEADWSC